MIFMTPFNTILIFLLFVGGVDTIYKKNQLLEKAEKALKSKNYVEAKAYYTTLINDLGSEEDYIKLNLAHTYFYIEKEEKPAVFKSAQKYYSDLTLSDNSKIASIAYNQLGLIQIQITENEENKNSGNVALESFKEALKKNPNNDLARYNYEILIRQEGQNQQNQDDKNEEQNEEKKEEQKENEEQQQDQQETKPDDKKLSKEQAEAILKTLDKKNADYLNQKRFKPKNRNKKKKDW